MTTVMTRNGVDVGRLVDTINAIKENPSIARFQFRTSTRWEEGGRSRTTIASFSGAGQENVAHAQRFELVGDEPDVLLGKDAGPNAVESVLHALASCIAVGYVYNAAAQGIDIQELTFDIEGNLDLRGFLGLSEEVRPGFSDIQLTYHVKADAPREKLEELCEYVQRTSPVLDIIRNSVPVSIELAG